MDSGVRRNDVGWYLRGLQQAIQRQAQDAIGISFTGVTTIENVYIVEEI